MSSAARSFRKTSISASALLLRKSVVVVVMSGVSVERLRSFVLAERLTTEGTGGINTLRSLLPKPNTRERSGASPVHNVLTLPSLRLPGDQLARLQREKQFIDQVSNTALFALAIAL